MIPEEPPIDRALRRAARDLTWDAGEDMALYVAARLHRSLLETAAGAEAAGLVKEQAVACYLHLCREVFDELVIPSERRAAGLSGHG